MVHININLRKWEWYKAHITYDEILKLAAGRLNIQGLPDCTVKFQIGKYKSTLLPDETLGVVDNMTIDVLHKQRKHAGIWTSVFNT